jgi:hypothetical protein
VYHHFSTFAHGVLGALLGSVPFLALSALPSRARRLALVVGSAALTYALVVFQLAR